MRRHHAIFVFMLRTRFAPSPTGLLHVGNAYSALKCQQWAEKHHARLLLRIEDIDHTRCRSEFTEGILEDLNWLGIRWHGQPLRQSSRIGVYREALNRLRKMDALYPCFCTRRKIQREIAGMGVAPHTDDAPDPYPGICRTISPVQRRARMAREPHAWRLDAGQALRLIDRSVSWRDGTGRSHPVRSSAVGDMIIGRRDIDISYHLAVILDDAEQGITHVIRGEDLRGVTPLHRLLQALLDLPDPVYIHHPLLIDDQGRRLAKRNEATNLRSLAESGVNPETLRHYLLKTDPPVWPFSVHDIQGNAALLEALE